MIVTQAIILYDMGMKPKRFKTYKEFYAFYLTEHSKSATKALHFVGTLIALLFLALALAVREPRFLIVALVNGYLFAWLSHFFIEKNRPATFRHPFYSFISDFKMFFEILTGRLKF
jgi:hypothetical protein